MEISEFESEKFRTSGAVLIITDRSSNPFSLLNPDVRRLHTDVADDNVLLVSSKSDEHQEQRRFELKTPPPRLPLLSSKRA